VEVAGGFAIVLAMSDAYNDPSANTAQFKAFVSEPEPETSARPVGLIVTGAILAAVAVGLAVWALI
jgi:hypothetical protein